MDLSIVTSFSNSEPFRDSIAHNNHENMDNVNKEQPSSVSSGSLVEKTPLPSSSSSTDNGSIQILTDNSSSDVDDNSLNDDSSSHTTIKSCTLSITTITAPSSSSSSSSSLSVSEGQHANFTSEGLPPNDKTNTNDHFSTRDTFSTVHPVSFVSSLPNLSTDTPIHHHYHHQSSQPSSASSVSSSAASTSASSSLPSIPTLPSSSSSSSIDPQPVLLRSSSPHAGNSYTSRFRGVYWRQKAWCAQIQHGGKKIYLGTHETEIAAAKEYDIAARKYHGTRALTNFDEQGNVITTNLLSRSGLREHGALASMYPSSDTMNNHPANANNSAVVTDTGNPSGTSSHRLSSGSSPHHTRSTTTRHHRDPIFTSSFVPDPVLTDLSSSSSSAHVLRSSSRLRRQSMDQSSNGTIAGSIDPKPSTGTVNETSVPRRKRSKDDSMVYDTRTGNSTKSIQSSSSLSSSSTFKVHENVQTAAYYEQIKRLRMMENSNPSNHSSGLVTTSTTDRSSSSSGVPSIIPPAVSVEDYMLDFDDDNTGSNGNPTIMNNNRSTTTTNTRSSSTNSILSAFVRNGNHGGSSGNSNNHHLMMNEDPHLRSLTFLTDSSNGMNSSTNIVPNQFSSVFHTSSAGSNDNGNVFGSNVPSFLASASSSLSARPNSSPTATVSSTSDIFMSPPISPNSQRLLNHYNTMVDPKTISSSHAMDANPSVSGTVHARTIQQILKDKGYGVPGISTNNIPTSTIVHSFLESHTSNNHQQQQHSTLNHNAPLVSPPPSTTPTVPTTTTSTGNSSNNLQNIIAMALRSNSSTVPNATTLDSNLRTFQTNPALLVPIPSALSMRSNVSTVSSVPGEMSSTVPRHAIPNITVPSSSSSSHFPPPPPLNSLLPRSISEYSQDTNETNNDNHSIQSSSYPFATTSTTASHPSPMSLPTTTTVPTTVAMNSSNNNNNPTVNVTDGSNSSSLPAPSSLPHPSRSFTHNGGTLYRTLSQSSHGSTRTDGTVSPFSEIGNSASSSTSSSAGNRSATTLGVTKNSRYGLIVREDGVRLRGKLSVEEKERVDTFLKAVEEGKIVLQKGELSKALQSAVNPERPVGFYEKLVSRRGLNTLFEAVLLSPTAVISTATPPSPSTPFTTGSSFVTNNHGSNNSSNSKSNGETVGSSTKLGTGTTMMINSDTAGGSSTFTPPIVTKPVGTEKSTSSESASPATPTMITSLSSSPPRTWGNPNIYGPGIGHGRYSIAVPSTSNLPPDMYPDSGFRYPSLPKLFPNGSSSNGDESDDKM